MHNDLVHVGLCGAQVDCHIAIEGERIHSDWGDVKSWSQGNFIQSWSSGSWEAVSGVP